MKSFLLCAALLLPLAAQEPTAAAAAAAVQRSDFVQARELYRKLAAAEPANIEYQIWVARLSGWLKEYDAAASEYEKALTLGKDNVEALTGAAYVQMWKSDYARAESYASRAAAIQPSSTDVLLMLARLHWYQHHNAEAARYLKQLLDRDPSNAEARALFARLDLPTPFELRLGYGHDRFSFADPGNVGTVAAGYVSERFNAFAHYEEWSRFGERTRRFGASYNAKLPQSWFLRASLMAGPGANVVARWDTSAGFSRSKDRLVGNFDYRFLRFSLADAHVFQPGVEYYFPRPVWIQGTFFQSRTIFRETALSQAGRVDNNSSVFTQIFWEPRPADRLRAGYAYGNESFTALTLERIGRFRANSLTVGWDHRFNRNFTLGGFYLRQWRENGEWQQSFGVTLTARR